MNKTITWADALNLSNQPEVYEAMYNFSHDSTEDNAVGVVLKVLQAHPAPSQPSAEAFDAWMQNPYTKVLEESIKTDYMPRTSAEALVQSALEAASKEPRKYALELADGIFGTRWPDEATAICNASTNMGDRIRALSAQQIIESCKEKS